MNLQPHALEIEQAENAALTKQLADANQQLDSERREYRNLKGELDEAKFNLNVAATEAMQLNAANQRIKELESEVADFKSNNRYQRGYADGEKEMMPRIAQLEGLLRDALWTIDLWSEKQSTWKSRLLQKFPHLGEKGKA